MKIKRQWISYFFVFLAAAGLRYFYGNAESDSLIWLLAPTTRWVSFLSGLEFIYEPGVGYINHAFRFIIAPSCAGVRFLIICMVMLVCSFVRRLGTGKREFLWTAGSLYGAYLFTIAVNGVRIVLAIWLPEFLGKRGLLEGWLSPERLHTAIGTAVYLLGLTVLYRAASRAAEMLSGQKDIQPEGEKEKSRRMLRPMLWYLVMVLILPLIQRILRNDYENFAEYVLRVAVTCAVIICLRYLLIRFRKGLEWLSAFFSDRSRKRGQQKLSL